MQTRQQFQLLSRVRKRGRLDPDVLIPTPQDLRELRRELEGDLQVLPRLQADHRPLLA
jgi:hypothetical protein